MQLPGEFSPFIEKKEVYCLVVGVPPPHTLSGPTTEKNTFFMCVFPKLSHLYVQVKKQNLFIEIIKSLLKSSVIIIGFKAILIPGVTTRNATATAKMHVQYIIEFIYYSSIVHLSPH